MRPSSRLSNLDTLIDALRSGHEVEREAAVARLRVVGVRALVRLRPIITSKSDPIVRGAALRALDGIDDRRVLDTAIAALADSDASVARAAIGVLRGWLNREPGTHALEALTEVALDRGRDGAVRLAALDALSDLPREIVQPVLDAGAAEPPRPGVAALEDSDAAHEWLAMHAAGAPLSQLHDLITHARERQAAERAAERRQSWLSVRGAAHAALARRGSRVALYDLREVFAAAAAPLPLDFLTAVTTVGEASCLEPMARAWAAAPHETWWREHLEAAATEIMHRTRLSGRSAVVKRIRAKYPGFL